MFIFRELDDISEGLPINGWIVNNIRYADDTIRFAGSEEGMQRLLNLVQINKQEIEKYGFYVKTHSPMAESGVVLQTTMTNGVFAHSL